MENYPNFDLSGKVALVTGAAKGIGRACALGLAQAGSDVALGLRDIQSGADLVEQIKKMGRDVIPLQMDTSSLEEINAAIEQAVEYYNRLDILINNTGIGYQNAAEEVPEKESGKSS